MAYTNLTAAQEKALVDALNVHFLGMEQGALLSFANVIVGLANAGTTTNAASIANLNSWATALATKLNADAGVTDVNYDTSPQS